MSTLAMTRALASIFVPIGITGAAIALVCALIVVFALARGSAGLAGGAIGVWIVGALLSAAACFANAWMPLIAALAALGVALVAGGLMRAAVRGARARSERTSQRPVSAETAAVDSSPELAPHPVTEPVRAAATVLLPVPVTDSIRVAA
jgi:hypothetical protein